MAAGVATRHRGSMTPSHPLGPRQPLVVGPAIVAPLLLLFGGLLRIVDQLGGSPRAGSVWQLGHVVMLSAFVVAAFLVAGLARSVPPITGAGRGVTEVLVGFGLLGTALSAWGVVQELYPEVARAVRLSASVTTVGLALLAVGVVGLLVLLVDAHALAWWSPVGVTGGALVVEWHLDLMPLGAALMLVGLAPLASLRLPLPGRAPLPQR
jgi:hypothetical protein